MTAEKETPAANMYKSKSSGAPSDGQAREKWVDWKADSWSIYKIILGKKEFPKIVKLFPEHMIWTTVCFGIALI